MKIVARHKKFFNMWASKKKMGRPPLPNVNEYFVKLDEIFSGFNNLASKKK